MNEATGLVGANQLTLEQRVLQYLRQRGFARAEEALRQDLSSHHFEDYAGSSTLDSQANVLRNILLFNQQQTSPEWYADSYRDLRMWVEASLDIYRNELMAVLFPVFVHCYLELIMKGFPQDAATFMEEFRCDHQDQFSREINSLISLSYPQDLEKNELAKRFREFKVDIELSSYSHQLLISFLQENRRYLLLKIINEHLNLHIVSAKPLHNIQTGSNMQTVTGYKPSEVNELNERNVRWGVLKEIDELRKYGPRNASTEANEYGVERRVEESAIPLPPLTDEKRQEIIQNLKLRVSLDAQSTLPSICFYTFLNSRKRLNNLSISDDGKLVAASFSGSSLKIWDLSQQQEMQEAVKRNESPYAELRGHNAAVYGMDFSADNRFLLSSSADSTIRLWLLEKGLNYNLVAYKGHNFPVWDVQFSSLGYYFVSGSNDRSARLWSTERIYPLRIFAGHLSDVDRVTFHPNCNYIATGSSDKSVRFWDIQSGDCTRIFTGHQGSIYNLAISPDGRMIASCGDDRKVILWDIGTGKLMQELTGHTDTVRSLSFSQEGNLLASGSTDCTVRTWNTMHAVEDSLKLTVTKPNLHIKSFRTRSTPVHFLKFSPRNLLFAGGVFSP